MKIKGVKISLRPFKNNDFEETIHWRDDKKLRFVGLFHPFPVSNELEKDWCEEIVNDRSNKTVYFAIEENEENRMIGYFQLKNIDWISNTCEFSIIIGKESDRGKGYGKEALLLCLQYTFESLNLRKISLDVLVENKTAIALYEKIGFIKEGIRKKHVFYDGKYWDILLMALTKPDIKF